MKKYCDLNAVKKCTHIVTFVKMTTNGYPCSVPINGVDIAVRIVANLN